MTTDAPDRPPLPELPPEIAAAIARTVTYANDDESITVIARGDMTLGSVDVQIFPGSHPIEVGAQLTSVCSVALDDVQQWTTATLLQSALVDDETRAMMTGAGPVPESGILPDPTVVTHGAVTVTIGPDMRSAEHLRRGPRGAGGDRAGHGDGGQQGTSPGTRGTRRGPRCDGR